MLSNEQLEFRRTGIGASEIGSIIGVPGAFNTALDIYLDKCGLGQSKSSIPETIIWGNLLEPVIADRYAAQIKQTLLSSPTIRHPHFHFLLATPDRLIEGTEIGVEIKTVGPHAAHNWADSVPLSYLLQCHQGMLVTGYNEWRLVALFCGQEMREYKIEYDPQIQELIINAASDFWYKHIEPRIPPAVSYHHPGALDALKHLYPTVVNSQIELSNDVMETVERWQSNKQLSAQYQKAADAEQALLLSVMAENGEGLLPNGNKLIRKLVKRESYEVKESSYVTLSYKESKSGKGKLFRDL